jgi:glutamyl-tRNA synthetase
MDDAAFLALADRFITSSIPSVIHREKMLALLKTRINKLSELDEKMAFFLALPSYDKELFLNKKNKIADYEIVKAVLNESLAMLDSLSAFDNDSLFAALMPLTEKLGIKTGTLMWCVRIAVSGMAATPGGATEIMEVIGKAESLDRIKTALAKL